jgi:hypothetical protein
MQRGEPLMFLLFLRPQYNRDSPTFYLLGDASLWMSHDGEGRVIEV